MTHNHPHGGGQIAVNKDDDGGIEAVAVNDPFLAALMDAAVDGVVIAGRDGSIRLINRACCRMFGYDDGELIGRSINCLMPAPYEQQHDRFIENYVGTGEKRIIGRGRETLGLHRDGGVFPIHLSVGHAIYNGGHYFVGFIRDISEKLEAEQRAHYLERHDTLTGVLSRQALLEEAKAAVEKSGGEGKQGAWALYTIDVDQFSDVNEAFGPHVGDLALKALVARMTEVLPRETYLGRIAADEFTAISRVSGMAQAQRLGQALFERVTASIYAERHWVRLRVSVGAAVLDIGASNVEELNAKGKLALQSVQQNGGNAICFYTPEMAAAATRRMLLTLQLTHAVERGELHVVYQPIVDAKSGAVAAAEALLRWTHPVLGVVSPGEFIPVAEESGLIIPISEWVFEQVAADMSGWETQGRKLERVFINISALQFLRGNLVMRINDLLARNPSLYGRIGLEITEQAAVRDLAAAISTIGELGAKEVLFAIDDFGSGYSSLSYVQQLPVAKLKIDRAFVVDVPENHRNAALVRAAVGMAHGLGLTTVAEGVETDEQRRFLVSVGCDFLQGYFFGKPMLADEFAKRLTAA
ncbi:MAG TPA: EAL domain-containing protein [Azospirillaceae bacterium]|nr:EAL domain-containing protein [Azospirillaceae bacterium]HRQ79855.1 EAL domain-containing protein [Azospirillaceae bacterium]